MVWPQSPTASTFSFTDELPEAMGGVTGDASQYVGGRAYGNLVLSPPVQSSHGVPRTFWEIVEGQGT